MHRHLPKFLLVMILLTLIGYISERHSISGELPAPDIITHKTDSVLTVGVIGDSWTYNKQLDPHIHDGLMKHGHRVRVISASHPGARSRHLYHDIHESSPAPSDIRSVLEEKPDFCVVVIGVNDAASQIGKNFYAVHVTYIVKNLLHNGISPVLVSLPEFGVRESIEKMEFVREYRNKITALINNRGEIDNIRTYRNALLLNLYNQGLYDQVIWVDFDKLCHDYNSNTHLYRDPMHLSKIGTAKLGQLISEELSAHLKNEV